ncbi:hypothetical protein MMC31_007863 [Peltigera leucophlebia]|nr:hypothetical protein [Peltigera leucophlebia]
MPPPRPGKDDSRSWNSQRQTINAVNQRRKIKDVLELARRAGFNSIADILIEDINQLRDGEEHYRRNLLAHPRFKALVLEDSVCHEMKQIVAKVEIKLPADNVTPETIEQFSLNNIDTLFHEHAGFTWSLIRTATNVVVIDYNVPNSLGDRLASIHVETNAVVDPDPDDCSSDEDPSDDFTFSSNDDHHNNNFDDSSNNLYTRRSIAINSGAPLKQYMGRAWGKWEENGGDLDMKDTGNNSENSKDDYTDSEYQNDKF